MKRLDVTSVRTALDTRVFGQELVYLQRTGSTNDVASDLAAQGAPEGTVVVADEQTTGRGRMGRRWLAPPGSCLLCSILFRPTLVPAQAQRLTMLCSLAAADAIEHVAGLQVAVKWPNDLIVTCPSPDPADHVSSSGSRDWRKLAGVLTETAVKGGDLEFAIVGIGINVNVEVDVLPTLSPNATSILAEVGRRVDRAALLVALLDGVERRHERLEAGHSPHQEWVARLASLGQWVTVTTAEAELTGVAQSVDGDGALLLHTPDGRLHRFLAGDVTLAPPGAERQTAGD